METTTTTSISAVEVSSLSGKTESNLSKSNINSQARTAANISLLVNIFLFIAKTIAFIISLSLSVVASLVDSAMDLFSQFIMFITERKMNIKKDSKTYPVGKTRLEPVGILIVSILMIMSSTTVIRESIINLVNKHKVEQFGLLEIILLSAAIFLKFILWLYCRQFKDSPIAMALAEDHLNDVISNSGALIFVILATKYEKIWWFDAFGGILISLYIIYSWFYVGKEEYMKILGKKADEDELEIIKNVTDKFCQEYNGNCEIDVIRAYHSGRNIVCEIGVIMDKNTVLEKIYNVVISLQSKVEELDIVERCFVYCDYMKRNGIDTHKRPVLV